MGSAVNHYDYLELLRRPFLLPQPWPRYKPKGLGAMKTSHPTYRNEIEKAVSALKRYFDGGNKNTEPLNCLILGPPGAGKTFLAKKLAASAKVPFKEHNVSLSSDPKSMLDELSKDAGGPKFVFIDEFDVTIGGSSVTRFLLDPITSDKHHQTAFVFSGSYLKNKPILERLNSNLSDFDFTRFLFHLIARQANRKTREHLLQLYQLCCLYQENRQTFTPDADLIQYLSQLHKLRDFLSRINGFIVQIPDLASPMMVTAHELILKRNFYSDRSRDIRLLEPKTAEYVRKFVEDTEPEDEKHGRGFRRFDGPNSAILDFKHMLLTERIGHVTLQLHEYIDDLDKSKNTTYFIKRQDLNYLIMVPLQHNIRSLKLLIKHCMDQEEINEKRPGAEGLARKCVELGLNTGSPIFPLHIGKEPYFDSPSQLWAFLATVNDKDQTPGEGVFSIENGEEVIRVSQVKGVITVLLIPNGNSGDDEVTFWKTQERFSGEELFHGIQLMGHMPSENEPRLWENGLMIQLDLLKGDDTSNVPQSPYLHPLLGRLMGEYTLILKTGDKPQPEKKFLVNVIDQLEKKNEKSGKRPNFLIDERQSGLPRLFCRTEALYDLVLWENNIEWPVKDLDKFLTNASLKKTLEEDGGVHWGPPQEGGTS